MLKLDQYELIRIAHRVYGQNISELARMTGHSRNTVKKAIRGKPWSYKERSAQPFPVLGPFIPVIDEWLGRDKDQKKKQRHTARRIFNRLQEEHGYKGSEVTVRRYVKMARLEMGIDLSRQVFIPCEPDIGREAEVDWGTAIAVLGGITERLKFFCMRSKYSGKHFVRFYRCERQQLFFDAHQKAFMFFGGIFPVLIYDNLTTAVQKVLRGRNRIEQESFLKFKAFYAFEARYCNPGCGHEKGGVEGLVGFARRNYMVPVPEAATLEELNESILGRCINYGAHKMPGKDLCVDALYEQEKQHLLPLLPDAYCSALPLDARVDKFATVIADKNRYSVPYRYTGQKVRVMLDAEQVEIYASNKKLAVHERLFGNNKWALNPDHYLELIQQRPLAFNSARPIRQWRKLWPASHERLLERFCQAQGETRGIKEFISVLMLYRRYQPGEVEAAVALALENRISSSDGVAHILIYTKESGSGITPLAEWPRLPAPDIAVYGQLGELR